MSFGADLSWVLPLRHPALTAIFEAFTLAGYPLFYLALLPLILALEAPGKPQLVAFLILSALLNSFQDFRRPTSRSGLRARWPGRRRLWLSQRSCPIGGGDLGRPGDFRRHPRRCPGRRGDDHRHLLKPTLPGGARHRGRGGRSHPGGPQPTALRATGRRSRTVDKPPWLPQGPCSSLLWLCSHWFGPDGPGAVLGLSAYLFGWWLGHRLEPGPALPPNPSRGKGMAACGVALAILFLGLSPSAPGSRPWASAPGFRPARVP